MTWDMRIATSTISDEMLDKILMHQINPKNLEQRKKIVRFYLQCKRYSMAVAALQQTIEDFKDDTQVAQDLQPTLQKLRIMYAQQMLEELGLRQESGQHALVQKISRNFPRKRAGRNPANRPPGARAVQGVRGEAEGHRRGLPGLDAAGRRAGRPRSPGAGAARDGPGLNPEMLPRMAAFLQNQNAPSSRPKRSSRWPSAAGCWGPTRPPPICRRRSRHGGCGGWCRTT